MGRQINFGFVFALVKRDLWKYFTNPTGYVFITLFIFLGATAAFWQSSFFQDNLANLDGLNELFPYLLIFFVPALTMSVWADEKRQGTDELLLTLPATSFEVVLGKYLSTLGIYTVSLFLSLSHVVVLAWLGSPDLGLMIANYFGYWLAGAALIAVSLLASQLTSNATIAFILGALFCALLTGTDWLESLSPGLAAWLAPLGVIHHFQDFARGVVSFSGLLYFLSLVGVGVYLNVLLVDNRHWPREADGYPMWSHHAARAIAVVVILASSVVIAGRAGIRLDFTAERLHSLSSETRRLLGELPEDRPVFIQAYISPEVPESLVQTRANLLSILREVDAIGGSSVQVLIEETEPFTEEARDAREKFGIMARQVPDLGSAQAGFKDVFMGLAFTSGAEEQVIPFFDRGLSAEYEITRSIRVVARTERKRIGVVDTEARVFGGFDFQSMRSNPPWSVVEELRKQYEVVQITPSAPLQEELDAMLVILPSSLSQEEMDNLAPFVENGGPTLFLVDPLPVINIGLAPSEQAGANVNPFMRQGQPPPKEKGNIQQFLSRLGVRWDSAGVVWDSYNPHPDLAFLPPEVVFVGPGNDNPTAFNSDHPASSGLQEVVLLYPGAIELAAGSQAEFVPLLESGPVSGRFSYFQMVQRNFLGAQLNRNLPHRPDPRTYVLAAQIREKEAEKFPAAEESDGESSTPDEGSDSSKRPLNLVVIADLDFISEQFFQIRQAGAENLNFDNVTFFLNSMDVLAGDESFVELRKKRVKHRTLDRVEEQTRRFVEQRLEDEKQAEDDAAKALADAQQRLDERVAELQQRPDLDTQTKRIMARNLQEVENRRLDVLKANIEAEKEAKISASKEEMEESIRRIRGSIQTLAVLLPPIPVFVLGVFIFLRRQRREREGAAAARRLRE